MSKTLILNADDHNNLVEIYNYLIILYIKSEEKLTSYTMRREYKCLSLHTSNKILQVKSEKRVRHNSEFCVSHYDGCVTDELFICI